MTDNTPFAKLDAAVDAIEADVAQGKIPLTSPDSKSESTSDIRSDNMSDASPRWGTAPILDRDSKVIDLSEHLNKKKLTDAELDQAEAYLEGLSSEIWREINDDLSQVRPALHSLHRETDGQTDNKFDTMSDTTLETTSGASSSSQSDPKYDNRPNQPGDKEAVLDSIQKAILAEDEETEPTGSQSAASTGGQAPDNADDGEPEIELPLAVRQRFAELEAQKAASEARLEEIKKDLDNYWVKYAPKPNPAARALGVVLSLGFVVVTVLYASYWLGTQIVARTGQGWAMPVCLIVGMLAGFYMGFILLAPIIKPRYDTAGNRLSADAPNYPEPSSAWQSTRLPGRSNQSESEASTSPKAGTSPESSHSSGTNTSPKASAPKASDASPK